MQLSVQKIQATLVQCREILQNDTHAVFFVLPAPNIPLSEEFFRDKIY
jgi:hypothetical protein